MPNIKNKKIAYKIIKELYKDKNSISVTLTGSYSEHFNLNKAGDIDIILICKKLNKNYFQKSINKIKSFKKKILNNDQELLVNSTFGPIKFYKKNSIVFHLMIYDLKSHIDHTIKSPFTCYDWERSKIYIGKSLKELSPVFNLQLRDFYEARRNNQEYLNDILKNKISYREYQFKKNKVNIKKKYFTIDEVNRRDFIYHTIKFLLINYIKFEKNINVKISDKEINKKFFEIIKNKKDLIHFKKLRNLKNNKSQKNIKNPKNFAINFIKNFNKHIKNKIKSSKALYFARHKKTILNSGIFLGQKLNPDILDKKISKEFKKIKIDKCITSPSKRCVETAKLVCKKNKIFTNNLLKEIDYGKAENLSVQNFKLKYPKIVKDWDKGKDPKFPNGESTLNVLNRLNKFLKKEISENNIKYKKNILILTHNVILRCLIGSVFRIKFKHWFLININYFDLLKFVYEKNKIRSDINRIKYLNLFNNFYIK